MRLHLARLVFALAILVPTPGCGGTTGTPNTAGEDEDEGDGRPDRAVTLYQGSLELFMEYPALVLGLESPLIAHFTDTRSSEAFEWVTSGRVVARLAYEDGTEVSRLAQSIQCSARPKYPCLTTRPTRVSPTAQPRWTIPIKEGDGPVHPPHEKQGRAVEAPSTRAHRSSQPTSSSFCPPTTWNSPPASSRSRRQCDPPRSVRRRR